jgi:hypothetical protein
MEREKKKRRTGRGKGHNQVRDRERDREQDKDRDPDRDPVSSVYCEKSKSHFSKANYYFFKLISSKN